MRGASFQTRFLLPLCFILLALLPTALADDDGNDDDDDDDDDAKLLGFETEDLGTLSMVLLIGTVALIGWKPLHIWLRKSGLERLGIEDVKAAKKRLTALNRWMMRAHIWIGVGAVVAGAIHGLGEKGLDLESLLVWLGWGGMLAMSVLGGLMMWKWPPREVKKGARALHTQRALLGLTVLFLVVGHEMF